MALANVVCPSETWSRVPFVRVIVACGDVCGVPDRWVRAALRRVTACVSSMSVKIQFIRVSATCAALSPLSRMPM